MTGIPFPTYFASLFASSLSILSKTGVLTFVTMKWLGQTVHAGTAWLMASVFGLQLWAKFKTAKKARNNRDVIFFLEILLMSHPGSELSSNQLASYRPVSDFIEKKLIILCELCLLKNSQTRGFFVVSIHMMKNEVRFYLTCSN